jgi:serine/threonine protein phosphatase PrpC
MRCTSCGQEQPDSHRFCEECGAALRPAPKRDPRRDRLVEAASPRLAAVSDVGRHYPNNEDFFALLSGPAGDALIVCDGVSTSQTPDVASAVACCAALDCLRRALASASPGPADLLAGLLAAESAVRSLSFDESSPIDPPQTTAVAALRYGLHLHVAWLGDSRAYLVGAEGARQLTEDHSWYNEILAAGKMTPAEARRSPLARAITRAVGGRADRDEPSLRSVELPAGPGHLVLCSDGLWGCLGEPSRLIDLVRRQPASADALAIARALVDHALAHGGHDNVTAAVLRLGDERP